MKAAGSPPAAPKAPTGRRSLPAAGRLLRLALPALLPAGLLLSACAAHPPQIGRVYWQQNLVNDPGRDAVYPAISLFVQAEDADGLEDLQELYLISDEEELFWRLDPQSWTEVRQGAETWIGSNLLSMPGRTLLPAGEYRVLLMDLGGGQAEQTLWISAPLAPGGGDSGSLRPQERFLPVTFSAGRLRIPGETGARGPVTLWLYAPDGRYRLSREYPPQGIAVRDLAGSDPELANGFQVRAYRFLAKENIGQISGPWFWRP